MTNSFLSFNIKIHIIIALNDIFFLLIFISMLFTSMKYLLQTLLWHKFVAMLRTNYKYLNVYHMHWVHALLTLIYFANFVYIYIYLIWLPNSWNCLYFSIPSLSLLILLYLDVKCDIMWRSYKHENSFLRL